MLISKLLKKACCFFKKKPLKTNIEKCVKPKKIKKNIQYKDIKRTVSIDNALVNATQRLILSEKRILMLALTKTPNLKEKTLPSIKLTASEFAQLYEIEINTAYEQIKKASESMIKKQVKWLEKGKNGLEKIEINWVSSARYVPGEGFVEITFTQEIQKYLRKLTKHFTTYQLQQAKALRSIYSWRLLELLSQFKTTGWREIELDQFLEIMEATEKQKKDFYEIKRIIIEPAIRELKEKAKWDIKWHTTKQGRKIKTLIFKFNINNKI